MDKTSTYQNAPGISEILQIKDAGTFQDVAWRLFHFQYQNNAIYRKWVEVVGSQKSKVKSQNIGEDSVFTTHHSLLTIPFLPISFFKSHSVYASNALPEIIFNSSGTTGMATSSHPVKELDIYKRSFLEDFRIFYGEPPGWAIVGLLPNYLERQGSSLVLMAEELMKRSADPDSGLYLYDFEGLYNLLKRREANGQKTWLIGVTFALLDFAEQYPLPLKHTVVLETGGMKGRKKEMTRPEVHDALQAAFGLKNIHSEYGMTELLSQAYSKENGRFYCPRWMKVLVQAEDDPKQMNTVGTGKLCIIDLANIYSCSFIATEDLGKLWPDGSFEVLGRMDNSDVRGCSQLFL